MATLEDIVAATKILSENPEFIMGGSGSKPEENRASDVGEDDGDDATVVASQRAVETATVGKVKEKIGLESLSSVSCSNSSIRVNDTDVGTGVNDSWNEISEKNETGEDSLSNIGEKLKEQNNGFRVGDIVWGKIRSHPWWPGQIYDPKDASEFAMRQKQEGRLLVAFFGDGSWSWCLPSQLKPFVENFWEMSRDSRSRSFLNAVQNALDEFGRLVELELTCNCIREKKKDDLARPVVVNAGLKAGVVMPKVDVHCLLVPDYKPAEVLEKVMQLGKTVSVGSALDLAFLRSWLSAFYYYKGGYLLPVYHGPVDIEGLEDKNKNVNEVANDFSVPIEVPILGPQDDDWLSSPAVGSVSSQGLSENKVLHKRKEKSVAELMGENKTTKPESRKRASVKEETKLEKSASSQKRKKNNDGEQEGAHSERASSTGKMGRKRKAEVLESPKLTNAKDLNIETSSFEGADGVNRGPLSGKPKGIEVPNAENAKGEAKEESDMASTPRERKKSKYLSPPYTNLAWRVGNSSFKTQSEVESGKTTKIAQVGEHEKDATGDNSASKPGNNTSEEKLANGKLEKLNVSDDKSSHTVKNDKKLSFSVSDVDAPVNELLLDIRLAALDPFYLSTRDSLDMVRAFVYAFRSSTYLHGQDFKVYRKCKADGRQKSLPSQLGNDRPQKKAKSPDRSNYKTSKTKGKSDTSNSKKAAETSVARNTMETVEGITLPCLTLEFAPEFPLPSKKDIVRHFGKFGSLNKKEIKVDKKSHSIQIVYMDDSDAEAAFKSSLSKSPFGSGNVNYRLQHSSAGSKSRRSHRKVSSPLKSTPEKREAPRPADDLVSDINNIRQKLEITAAILENYHSKFSSQDKSTLKDEMKHLMENVETVSEKVRIMAEKTSR